MARIRSIKPEFPQSESMGNVSRDARLLFIQLWTLCDDEGRTRGNSRMLASLLFPYDNDAPDLIDSWIDELEEEACILRYQVGGATYIQILNWLNHQKIDKPSASKLPAFDESSRILANPRESSPLEGKGREGIGSRKGEETPPAAPMVSPTKAQKSEIQVSNLISLGVAEQHARDWLKVRQKKRAPEVTQTVIDGIMREATKAGITFADAIRVCAEKSWQGFDASWMNNSRSPPANVQEARLAVADQIMGRNRRGAHNQIIDITPSAQVESD